MDRMEFRERIKELRTENALTHTQLASILDKSEAAIRAWESGRTKPDADTLIKLSEHFHCSADYMLGLSDIRRIISAPGADGAAPGVITRLNSLNGSEKAYILDIFEQVLTCLEEFTDENARETFLTGFFSLFMDLRLSVSGLADYLGGGPDGAPQEHGQAMAMFATMRDITDMDYQSLWCKLERLLDEEAGKNSSGQRVLTAGAAV